jgi:hypothetical protein
LKLIHQKVKCFFEGLEAMGLSHTMGTLWGLPLLFTNSFQE